MATLRVRDLKIGHVYLEPLSGYRVRVRRFGRDAFGDPIRADVVYHNPVTGRLEEMALFDGELQAVTEPSCP